MRSNPASLISEPRHAPHWTRLLRCLAVAQPSRFTVLARHDRCDLTGGAILHDAGAVVGLSNTWASEDGPVDPRVLLEIAAETHPGRAVVDYAWGPDLETMLGAGFEPLGPQHVWIR